MDILYVIGNTNREELKYSLRSIAKYGRNVGRIFIAGYCPEYVNSDIITFIPQQDEKDGYKHNNILNCIKHTIIRSDISNDFLYSSDDHFYIRETDFDNYPYFCKSNLEDKMKIYLNSTKDYHRSLAATFTFLKRHGFTTHNFSWHGNTHFNKKKFIEIMPIVEEAMMVYQGIEPTCLMLNAMYCDERFTFEITNRKDRKLKKRELLDVDSLDRECISTSDLNFTTTSKRILKVLFPDKCIYEK